MSTTEFTHFLADEGATLEMGQQLATLLTPPLWLYLQGDLGAGKTTLVRGLLAGLGYSGHVKSPTYTLVESYSIDTIDVYHFDLYRLSDPQELEYAGIRDYTKHNAICLVEWPEQGQGVLPAADLIIQLAHQEGGRQLTAIAVSEVGQRALVSLRKSY